MAVLSGDEAHHAHGGADVEWQFFQIDSTVGKGHQEEVGDVEPKSKADGPVHSALPHGVLPALQPKQKRQDDQEDYGHVHQMPGAETGKDDTALLVAKQLAQTRIHKKRSLLSRFVQHDYTTKPLS